MSLEVGIHFYQNFYSSWFEYLIVKRDEFLSLFAQAVQFGIVEKNPITLHPAS